MDRIFILSKIGNGWQATSPGSRVVGYARLADNAIRDWRRQYNRVPCVHCGKTRGMHYDMVNCFGKDGQSQFTELESTFDPSYYNRPYNE